MNASDGPTQIQWNLIGAPGWAFTDDGIKFSDPSQFTQHTYGHGGPHKWLDLNTVYGEYKYTITVTNGTSTVDIRPDDQESRLDADGGNQSADRRKESRFD